MQQAIPLDNNQLQHQQQYRNHQRQQQQPFTDLDHPTSDQLDAQSQRSRDATCSTSIDMSYLPTSRRRTPARKNSQTHDDFGVIPMRPARRLRRIVLMLAIAAAVIFLFVRGSGQERVQELINKAHPGALPDTTACKKPLDPTKPLVQYVLMLDAGSTGSRIHVYKFNNCGAVPKLEKEAAFKMIKGGLSSYPDDPEGAAHSLDELMDLAVRTVPAHLRSCSPVALKATAGLRLLGPEKSDAILQAVRTHLELDYPFPVVKPDGVVVMDGKDEGVYAWITTNYLLGNIGGPEDHQTAAVFDLGGGSTQIVFEPSLPLEQLREGDHLYKLDFGGRKFNLYQQSHLGYGLMEARKSIHREVVASAEELIDHAVVNPCIPPGMTRQVELDVNRMKRKLTMVGPKDPAPAQCRALAERVLKKDAVCHATPCSFNGIHQPSLAETFSGDAFIFSYFYDRLIPLGLPSSFTVDDVLKLTDKVCAGPAKWNDHFMNNKDALAELNDRPEYCLDLSFISALLHHGYDMPLDRRLKTAKKLSNNELGWCLGASLPLLDTGSGLWSCKVEQVA
ncbi:Guanosine-diphosphatase [Savitreella phatthalungensis]